MKKLYTLAFLLLLSSPLLFSQMWNGTDTLYGNEWINYDQSYYKILIAEDGIYRIPKSKLESAGIPIGAVSGDEFQLFYMGQEIPLYTSTDGAFSASDYIEFYGRKNRSELDRFLFADPDNEMLNPDYSLFTDTSAYFLTWTDNGTTNRYDEVDNNLSNLPDKEDFFLYKEKVNYHAAHIKESFSSGIFYSHHVEGEGFANPFSSSLEIPLTPKHISTALGESNIAVTLLTDSGPHNIRISFNGSEQLNDQPSGYTLQNYDFDIATSSLTGDDEVLIEADADANDYHAVSSLVLTYPRTFDFDGQNSFQFTIKASNNPLYLEIENFDAGSGGPVLYDLTNHTRMETTNDNGLIKIKLPPSGTERDLVLISENAVGSVDLQTTGFIDYDQQEGQFIIISNPRLFNDGNGNNRVQEYADYRSSNAGGNYTATVVDIRQLYDQFAYGIHRHSISIRNFGHYIAKEWSDPQYVFLIGKGREYHKTRTQAQLTADENKTFYLPTFGYPGSDNLLLGGLNTNVPVLPIARIAVSDPEAIKTYLEKVQLMESNSSNPQTIEDRLWMKRVLHLGGGGPNEQATIKNHLINMERVIESNKFGAEVTSFYKNSSDPIQIGESDEIFNTINNGVSIITFFGHSAVGTFDFNIDNPSRYENYGKYPLLLSLGCYSGNIHTTGNGISERFIFLEDKGAMAFGASTGQGFISSLRTFAERYYALIGSDFYGEGIGKTLQETIRTYENQNSIGMVTLMQQFTLHGDPSLRLNPSPGPDYTTGPSSVSFEPEIVTAQTDSITIHFSIVNLGYNISDSIVIEIEQQLPGGDEVLLVRDKVPAPGFETKLSYTVASFGKTAAGLNRFFISLDTDNDVDEFPAPSAESNNELVSNGAPGVPLFIFDDSAQPVYPPEFAIVNEETTILKASTSTALAPERKYIMEIDTTERFNSPIKKRTEIIQGGGVVKWQPNIDMTDNTVYYWRISPDSIDTSIGYIWENSSFVYLPNSSKGWNQSHYYQYQKDEFEGLLLPESQQFSFGTNGFFITVKNKLYDPVVPPAYIYNFSNPAASVRPWKYIDAGVAVVVGDSITGAGWANTGSGLYGSVNSGTTRVFSFPTDTQEDREALITFLEDIIPSNNFVFVFTVQKPGFDFQPEAWAQDSVALQGKNIFNVLEAQGAARIRELETKGTVPYTFVFQKDKSIIAEDIAETIDDVIITEVFIPINRVDGSMQSVTIGPASEWYELNWQKSGIDDIAADTAFIRVFGIGKDNSENLLIDRLYNSDTTLNFVDAGTTPFLKLVYYSIDDVNRTPTQLDHWRVLYDGLPDASINADLLYTFKSDTLQQGDQMQIELAIENVSDYDMDSLLVKLSVIDQNNNELVQLKRYPPLVKNGAINTEFELDTKNLSDFQQLVMEVNPEEDQPELYHFNNFAVKQFFVEQDKKNPILDVTFDGIHIMDGDIVSPKPTIFISLKDENPFLELSDTALFKIFLKYPGANVAENISFENDWVKFFPATLSGQDDKNNAYIEFTPVFEEDGIYQLLVQAEDATGNQSGEIDYKVNFEVVSKQAISNVLNYPNPFSTSTQFIYTLTGEEVPEYFKIQILTVSGKIVKEITEDELGPLKIGTHRTDYRWDGTDNYGSKLANGVYLYRIVAKKSSGEDYEAFDTGTDQFFRQGFGKLVILR